jgi:hypothetical protein
MLNFRTVFLALIVFCMTILHTNCAPHCDDEDYTRDQKKAALQKQDSLDVPIVN